MFDKNTTDMPSFKRDLFTASDVAIPLNMTGRITEIRQLRWTTSRFPQKNLRQPSFIPIRNFGTVWDLQRVHENQPKENRSNKEHKKREGKKMKREKNQIWDRK
jgi:hypothetical protein